jgi:hypothetical protein
MAKAGTMTDAGIGLPERIESVAKTRRAFVGKTAPRWLRSLLYRFSPDQALLVGALLPRRSEAMAMARYFSPAECF